MLYFSILANFVRKRNFDLDDISSVNYDTSQKGLKIAKNKTSSDLYRELHTKYRRYRNSVPQSAAKYIKG